MAVCCKLSPLVRVRWYALVGVGEFWAVAMVIWESASRIFSSF